MANRKLIKFDKEKWPVLHQGKNNPMYQGKLGADQLRSDPEQKAVVATRDAIGASGACWP